MKKLHFLLLNLLLLSLSAQAEPERFIIKPGHLLAANGQLAEGLGVVVEGGLIKNVERFDQLDLSQNARIIEYPNMTLIPGLIEAHSHLFLHPYNETSWDDQVLKESQSRRVIRALNHAKDTLFAGFTTMRDLGTEGAGNGDVDLRDAIEAGEVIGPRLKVVTRAIVAFGAYGPSRKNYNFNTDLHEGAQEVSGVEEAKKAVREQIQNGADWIKIYADFEIGPNSSTVPTFTEEELSEIVKLSHQLGRPVAAHATSDQGMQRAIAAGVDTIEHGLGGTRETFRQMAKHHIAWLPTITQVEAYSEYFEGYQRGISAPTKSMEQVAKVFKIALSEGVTIGVGSDVGVYQHGTNFRELEWMVKLGMTPKQVILAATKTNAAILKMDKQIGEISPGYFADMVVVSDNPLENIETLKMPVAVFKGGRLVFDAKQ
jgi:imidazolonepropionase-like amidohydrolase